MSFASATNVMHGDFYYVSLGDNSNHYEIKGWQDIIQFGKFISVCNKKVHLSTY